MLALVLVLVLVACGGAPPRTERVNEPWTAFASGTNESLRGLTVVDARVIWASGAHGVVVRSIDGGAHWTAGVIPTAEELDFRSLHAFDADRAVVLSAGSPARAFVTSDGGGTWRETYTREGEGVFFDSLAFDGNEGVAIGDPLPAEDGLRFALLVTHDAGHTWEDRVGPVAQDGEAAFAASNGCIALLPEPVFVTSAARLMHLDGTSSAIPMPTSASAGPFAIAFASAVGYAIGGDYGAPTSAGSFARTSDGGGTWTAGASPRGYRSSIAIADGVLIVVGTSGSDVSYDEGARWLPIDDVALNTVRIRGDDAFAVGPAGRVVHLSLR